MDVERRSGDARSAAAALVGLIREMGCSGAEWLMPLRNLTFWASAGFSKA